MLAIQSLITHGWRASRLANVRQELCATICGGYRVTENNCLADHHTCQSQHLSPATTQCSVVVLVCVMSDHIATQDHPKRAYLRRATAATNVQSAQSTNSVSTVAVRAEALGSRTAEMSATHSSVIHGPRASGPASILKRWLNHPTRHAGSIAYPISSDQRQAMLLRTRSMSTDPRTCPVLILLTLHAILICICVLFTILH